MQTSTTYYWQIVSTDANGSTAGPVWSFTTEPPCAALPSAPCTPNPADGGINLNVNTNLAWACGDSQCAGLSATYEVYFGTDPAQLVLQGSTATKAWILPKLLMATTYYWQVVVIDANGSTPGPVWSFTTR